MSRRPDDAQRPRLPSDPPQARKERLRRFTGRLERDDGETADFWRRRSPAEHARAMIELAEYAEAIAAETGMGKPADEMFPGLPRAGRAGVG